MVVFFVWCFLGGRNGIDYRRARRHFLTDNTSTPHVPHAKYLWNNLQYRTMPIAVKVARGDSKEL